MVSEQSLLKAGRWLSEMGGNYMLKKIVFPDTIEFPGHDYPNAFSDWFRNWYQENVVPINDLFHKAIAVVGKEEDRVWFNASDQLNWTEIKVRAYLIGIEPIKKETAEDVLRDIFKDGKFHCNSEIIARAQKVLGEQWEQKKLSDI